MGKRAFDRLRPNVLSRSHTAVTDTPAWPRSGPISSTVLALSLSKDARGVTLLRANGDCWSIVWGVGGVERDAGDVFLAAATADYLDGVGLDDGHFLGTVGATIAVDGDLAIRDLAGRA